VRLKDPIGMGPNLVGVVISIPSGAIKSMPWLTGFKLFYEFQFLLVRLKSGSGVV